MKKVTILFVMLSTAKYLTQYPILPFLKIKKIPIFGNNKTQSMNAQKKILSISILLFLVITISAQTSPFRFGVKAGLNASTAFVNEADKEKFKLGYHFGATVEYNLPKNFLIQSGLFFSAKGSKIDGLNAGTYDGGKPDFTHTYNQLYLELPLYGAYRINLSKSTNIVLGVGPYFAYGVGGKTKQKLNSGVWSGGITEIEWDTFSDGIFDDSRDWLRGESLNRFDFGFGINADVEYNKFVLGIGAKYGVINILKDHEYSSDDLYYRNLNLSLSLGYKF